MTGPPKSGTKLVQMRTTPPELAQPWEGALRAAILAYPWRQRRMWQRSYASIDAFLQSVEPNRQRWAEMMQAPDKIFNQAVPEIATNAAGAHTMTLILGADLRLTALYRMPDAGTPPPYPLVLLLHGIGGSPEMALGHGDTEPPSYHAVGQRLSENGFAVLAPMLINNFRDRARINRMALLLGSHIWALELQAIRRFLDGACSHLQVDPNRIAVWGHSMGGAYALYTMPIEPRFRVGIISAWFNHRLRKMVVEDSRYSCFLPTEEEHAFLPGLLTGYSDPDLVSLICPRPLLLQTGATDSVSFPALVAEEFAQARAHYDQLGLGERIQWDQHAGGHEVNLVTGVAFLHKWLRERGKSQD